VLGFDNIVTGEEADISMVRFFQETLPKQLPFSLAKFRKHQDLIHDYAVNQDLRDDSLPDTTRAQLIRQFLAIVLKTQQFKAFKL
jgi:hypothetical protein